MFLFLKQMKASRFLIPATIIAVFTISAFTLLTSSSSASAVEKQNKGSKNVKSDTGIKWLTFEEALVLQEKEPRMWVIDFWTDWCGWCKRMEATTFSDPIIGKYVNENYYAVSFDAEQKGDVVVNGRTYKFVAQGNRGYHELAAELMQGQMSYPTVVFLDRDMNIFQALPGYRTKEDFLPIVEYFHQYNPATPVKWEDFQKNFKNPYPAAEGSGQ
jgi:thioredoxin-related protein